jgi:hypothetical protein
MNLSKDAATIESWAAPDTSVTRRNAPYNHPSARGTNLSIECLRHPVAHGPADHIPKFKPHWEAVHCAQHIGAKPIWLHPIRSTQMSSNRGPRGREAPFMKSGDAFAATNRPTLRSPEPAITLSHAASRHYGEQKRQARASTRIPLLWLHQSLRLVLMTTMLHPKSRPASHLITGV